MFRYFGDRISLLDPSWNYKPYWDQPGPGEEPARIMHWHGMKPGLCLTCMLKHRFQGVTTVREKCKLPAVPCYDAYLGLWSRITDNGEHYVQSLLHHWQALQDIRETPDVN